MGAVVGGKLAQLGEEDLAFHTPPESLASSVAPVCAREGVAVWWSRANAGRNIALTFDDGPTQQLTPHVLDILDGAGIRATFFVIGDLAQRHPDLVRRARDAGHQIENHSQDHRSAAVLDRGRVRAAMERGADTIERLTGRRSTWYRPPRGEVTSATLISAGETGHVIALWSLARDDHGELADDDSAGVGRHLMTAVKPGDVVDLHDGLGRSALEGPVDAQLLTRRSAELAALPEVLRSWAAAGYAFARVDQLLPAKV
jgi:peptidoglycan/xylan/chitin deacetylase (PgdA/CDA1 family)